METEDQNEKNKEDNKADQQVFLTVNDRMKTGFIHRKSPDHKIKSSIVQNFQCDRFMSLLILQHQHNNRLKKMKTEEGTF